ncbi:F0F1 ATP synthase subunit alpha, partial [Micromonospora sp. DH15]|nr:F0F1 ATP synthase subunit alpha [Micromonospora sp. DH15]
SRAQLERGSRLVELLKQPNYSPFPVQEQTVSVWAGTEGKLDDIPVGEIRRFEAEFLQYLRHKHEGTLAAIADNKWNDEVISSLDQAIASFKQTFLGKEDAPRINEAPAAPLEGDENRETVTRYRDNAEK